MEPSAFATIHDQLWAFVAAPVIALCAVILTVALRLPQIRLLRAAFRGARAFDPKAGGSLHPLAATAIDATVGYGAAAAVGAATAIALGGPGAIAWVWLFCFLIAPLRVAEVMLARTRAAGTTGKDAGKLPGSLAERLLGEKGPWRIAGWLLLGLLLASAVLFVGGVHGRATIDAAEGLVPDGALPLALGVAVVAAGLGGAGARRTGAVAAALGGVALVVLVLVALLAAASHPDRALGAIARAVAEAIDGAPTSGAFTGAFAGEVVVAALLHVLPPLGAAGGASGAIHAEARAATTRGQAAAALLGPLVFAVVTTILGVAIVGTHAFNTPHEGTTSLADVTIYRGLYGYESASQREEPERLWTGYVRIRRGSLGVQDLSIATERGMIEEPRFEYYGRSADLALHTRGGKTFRILRKKEHALGEIPIEQGRHVTVSGRMLIEGGPLIAAAARKGAAGPNAARLALAALLILAAVAAAGWGYAASRALRPLVPPAAAAAAGVLPAVGIAMAAMQIPWLGIAGGIAGALLALVTAVVIAAKAGEARRLSP